jgi:Bcr/CflA subfamily drug resistance transporter
MIQQPQNKYLVLIIGLVAVAQCGFALYLPSLPAITESFHTEPSAVQSTVFLYVLGISLSQWFYGPASDYYGRRRIALFGLMLFIGGAILALLSNKLNCLLIGRGIQGIGMGAVMTVSRAILRDVFKGKAYVKNASKLASVIAVSPVIFPVFGGYLQAWWGWKANFVFMLVFALIVALCWCFFFTESKVINKKASLNFKTVSKNYIHIIRSPIFIKNTLCGGLIYAGEVIFLTIAPFLIQQKFHLPASLYGWLMFIAVVGFIFGSQASSYLANRLRHERLILVGLGFCLLSVCFLFVVYCLKIESIFSILSPVSLFMFGAGFVYPNTSVGAVGYFPENAGTASALLSSIQGGVAMAATAIIIASQSNSLATLMIGFAIIVLPSCVLGLSIFYQEKDRVLD